MTVLVRELAPGDDAGALGRIVLDAYAAEPGYPREDDYERELVDVAARATRAVVAVAELDGKPIGCVTYVPDHTEPMAEHDDPEAAAFRMLAVRPDVQGSGAGRAMVQWCAHRARSEGKRRLLIHSGVWMVRAHRLYERLGFERRPDLDWVPVPGVHLLGFALEL